jgi:large subunit ribosomal protein L20
LFWSLVSGYWFRIDERHKGEKMARVKWQVASRRRRKRLLKQAKGYWGARARHIRRAKETLMRAMAYATRDRKSRKREFRSLWVIRLNAAARARGLTYSQLMAAFTRAKIGLDRKQLSELAIHDQPAFDQLVETAMGQSVVRSP